MAALNPLEVLGVSRLIVEQAVESGNYRELFAIAQGAYRLSSKALHPDRGGDAELMARLTQAFEDIGDPDGLEYYAEELLGVVDIQRSASRRESVEHQVGLADYRHRLLALTQFTDMFALLGLGGPTSFLILGGEGHYQLDVTAPTEAVLKMGLTPIPITEDDLAGSHYYWRDGAFEEWTEGQKRRREARYEHFQKLAEVTVIGFTPNDPVESRYDDVDFDAPALTGLAATRVTFSDPDSAWFMRQISPFDHQSRSDLVLARFDGTISVAAVTVLARSDA